MSIFKACDVRGVYGEELDEAMGRRIGRSLGLMMRRRGQQVICVGGDYRRSTPVLKAAMMEGLLEAGATVRDLGQLPTPMIYFAGRYLQCPNVAVVTASHNAAKYNGIKFMIAGRPAIPELMAELEKGLQESAYSSTRGCAECVEHEPLLDAYIQAITRQAAELAGHRRSVKMKIVLDTMEGAYTKIAPAVLTDIGARVVSMSDRIDPDYVRRTPNPSVDKNITELCARVPAEEADLGIALDGDGDRVVFVDHQGVIVRPEQIGALLVKECFERPTVVYDLKCASVLEAAVLAAGGRTIMQPSGYGFIKSMMIDRQAEMGLEVSGHHFFKVLGGGDDGLFTALLMVFLLSRMDKPLGELIASIGWPAISPDLRIPLGEDIQKVLERIAAGCGGEVTRLDGVRARYEDGWALARASITEPVITLRFEGRDQKAMRAVAMRFLATEPELVKKVMEIINDGRTG